MNGAAKATGVEQGPRLRGIDARAIWIVAASVAFVLVLIGGIVAIALSLGATVFRTMDRTQAHLCGLAAVRRSPAAIAAIGAPIRQRGATGGSWSSENGTLWERATFTVSGPLGSLSVRSEGTRSPLESHLRVRAARGGRSLPIYSGPFDCPELHAR